MTNAAPAPLLTAREFAGLPDDGNRYELVRGRLVLMSPSAIPPSRVAARLTARLGPHIESRRLGEYGVSEGGFTLFTRPDTVRAPDVWFVRAANVPDTGLPDGFWPGAPDLAVEVLSPPDRYVEVLAKVRDYLAAGTELVWVIDPQGRSAATYRHGGIATLMGEDGALDGEDVVPGFRVVLTEILA